MKPLLRNRKRIVNLRGTPEALQRDILLDGVENQHMILCIIQPKPMLGGALVIGFRIDEHTPAELRAELKRHVVHQQQARLIRRYYQAELRFRRSLTQAESDALTAPVFIVKASQISPDLHEGTDDA